MGWSTGTPTPNIIDWGERSRFRCLCPKVDNKWFSLSSVTTPQIIIGSHGLIDWDNLLGFGSIWYLWPIPGEVEVCQVRFTGFLGWSSSTPHHQNNCLAWKITFCWLVLLLLFLLFFWLWGGPTVFSIIHHHLPSPLTTCQTYFEASELFWEQ